MSKESRRKGVNGNGGGRHYFVQPLDSHTNEVIASRLEESDFCDHLVCRGEVICGLWQCHFDFAKLLWQSARDLKLRYNLFFQDGDGPIRRKKSNRLVAKKSAAKILGGLKR